MKHLQVLKTKDNSFTLYSPQLNETYHSRHGALQESLHVFIKNGLHYFLTQKQSSEINILEIGFGTGLNTLLTYLEAEKIGINIDYSAIEPHCLDIGIISALKYTEALQLNPQQSQFFQYLHGNKKAQCTHFSFDLFEDKFLNYTTEKRFDIIYFDAFAPEKNPELWTNEVFLKCKSLLNENGILVTYCAKGEVKRTIKRCGLKLETLAGPPGKREMIRAVNIINS